MMTAVNYLGLLVQTRELIEHGKFAEERRVELLKQFPRSFPVSLQTEVKGLLRVVGPETLSSFNLFVTDLLALEKGRREIRLHEARLRIDKLIQHVAEFIEKDEATDREAISPGSKRDNQDIIDPHDDPKTNTRSLDSNQ